MRRDELHDLYVLYFIFAGGGILGWLGTLYLPLLISGILAIGAYCTYRFGKKGEGES